MYIKLLHRIVGAVLVWLGVTLVTFAIIRIIPGDPVRLMLDVNASETQIEQVRAELGLNSPFLEQYLRYLANAVMGDMGISIRSRSPVLNEIVERMPNTLALAGVSLTLAVFIGISAGIYTGVVRHGWFRSFLKLGMVSFHSIPTFVLALFCILLFGVHLGWIPVVGGGGLLFPSLCAAAIPCATIARFTEAKVIEVLEKDYIRTARAKGASELRVILHHALRNALIPILTITGLLASELMTGTAFVEMIFNRPGLGRFAINAVANRDFPQIQGIVLFTATIYFIMNWVVDFIYILLEPRLLHD